MKHINHKGFSLLEILLTITLLSILFAILVTTVRPRNIIFISEDNRKEADALTIYQALEQYALKNNAYPEAIKNMPSNRSLYICKTSAPNCTKSNQINLSTNILVPTYFSKIPEYSNDTNNSGFYVVKDTNGKIGIGGVRRLNDTTFVKGLDNQSFATTPLSIICDNPSTSGLLAWGVPANGVTISIPYEGAGGQSYTQQLITSTGVTGLTATLSGGSFANGSGNLIFNITGTPSGVGIANFSSTIIGNTCSFAANSTVPPIVTNGLVLHLDAGNAASYPGTGTTWTDLSGNGNNGALINGVGFNSANGGSLVFYGVNDYVSRSSNVYFNISTGDYTIDGWYYPNVLSDSQTALSLGTPRSNLYWVLNPASTSGKIYFGTGNGSWGWTGQHTTAASNLVAVNQWNNVTVVKNGATLNIYVNAVLVSSVASFNFGSGQGGTLYIGTYFVNTNNDGSWFRGRISNLKFYQGKALTPSEIQQNFNALRGRFGL